MLRYKTKTRPGLVALYDIRPGNGAGPFLQPRSPHGARYEGNYLHQVRFLKKDESLWRSANVCRWWIWQKKICNQYSYC